MKLNKMHKYKKQLDVSYCLNALDGLFGFSKDTLESGNFSGALFRFPFREEKTALSDNVYSKAKILDLFKAFQAEASVDIWQWNTDLFSLTSSRQLSDILTENKGTSLEFIPFRFLI
jgi:hypothetical protein